MTLAEEINTLQARLATAQRERDRAEGARDTAQAALDRAFAELKTDFDVENSEQADELLTRLRAELTVLVADINAKLDQIGL